MFAARYATLIAAQQPAATPAMAFDAHALACALASADADSASLPQSLGLSGRAVDGMMARVFPWLFRSGILFDHAAPAPACEECAMLADLLIAHRAGVSEAETWFAHIIARRALEPGHLWQAMGLFERAELRQLIERHFPTLAARNTANMRWKKFFYRELCAHQGFTACPVPDCRDCTSWAECFGPEDGDSRLAA
jgi:nitrogen fixation protein NifQ